MKNGDIKVSICCITYNQKEYISKAIDSFLAQKTNFKFEILIHDDCSTDGTIDILKEYEKKYPKLIKVIYEDENQYSKGVKVTTILYKYCKGKYIALCEGDDYWCDKNKLQIQYDFMEKHPNCSLTVHACYLLDDVTNKRKRKRQPYFGSRVYSTKEIILGDGDLFATNSMFYRREYINNLPAFYYLSPVGDYPLTIYLSLCGKVYFINKAMSIYRVNAKGSWTTIQNNQKKVQDLLKKKSELNNKLEKMLNIFNEYTGLIYKDSVYQFTLYRDYSLHLMAGNWDLLKDNKYKKLYGVLTLKGKIKLFMIRNCPIFNKFLRKAGL